MIFRKNGELYVVTCICGEWVALRCALIRAQYGDLEE